MPTADGIDPSRGLRDAQLRTTQTSGPKDRVGDATTVGRTDGMRSSRSADDRSRQRADWMARAQTGDATAYRALLDDIGPAIAGFLGRRIGDVHDAEDAYQDTFVALHRARHTYQPTRPIEPWLFAIARNVVADHGRRRRRTIAREVLSDAPPERSQEVETGLRAQIANVLGRLPPAQREALEMLKVQGLTVREAAARAGTSAGALKVRAHRAYVVLRAALRA